MLRKNIIFLFSITLGFYSCKKDSPTGYPTVVISSPYSMEYFNVPATIQVTGTVSDAKSLTSVSIYIANSQNTPVEHVVQIPITSNNMNISYAYSLNDIHMASGQYYLTISASNGTNTQTTFRQINVDALPTQRTAVYAVTRSSAGINAWKINPAFQDSLSYTVSGDYSSSDVNSYYQQFYIAAHDSGNLSVYSVPTINPYWSITGDVSPTPYFTNIYCNEDNEFVSYYNLGYVKVYNHSGAIQATYAILSGYFPIKTFLWQGYLFVEEKSVSSSQENLWSFYEATTASYQQTALGGPLVAMFGYDNNDLFVFGNNSSVGAYMQMYNIHTNLFYSPISLSAYGKLLSAVQINPNTYLIGFSDGKIYQYTYSPNSITPYINGITASNIRYDSINNQVITSSGKMVSEYNYGLSSGTFVTAVSLPDSVMDIRILYNK